jgi:hypothetical protein
MNEVFVVRSVHCGASLAVSLPQVRIAVAFSGRAFKAGQEAAQGGPRAHLSRQVPRANQVGRAGSQEPEDKARYRRQETTEPENLRAEPENAGAKQEAGSS